MKGKIENLSAALGIEITNPHLFESAFIHKSYANEHKSVAHNERLEYLGDAVLELAVTKHLFDAFPDEPEGKLTKYRSALVSGVSLAGLAKKLGLGEFLALSRGEESSGGRKKNPILADTLEALIGAIYLDAGFDAAEAFLTKHLFPKLPEVVAKRMYVDPKSGFQEWSQDKLEQTPEYRVLSESGPDHDKTYLVGVFVGEQQYGEGTGSSKQKAETAAAENALEKL